MKNKIVKIIFLFLFLLLFSPFAFATEPQPIVGKVLKAGIKLCDSSDWIEIATYGDYSLILRVNCFPKSEKFDLNKNRYTGYAKSNVKSVVDDWFFNLDQNSELKKHSVGNTALLNLGFYGLDLDEFGDVYSYQNEGEARGNGISFPIPNSKSSPFILSYQEVRKYTCAKYEFFDCSSKEAYGNYKRLVSENSTFWRPGVMETSWLRSPGKDVASACSSGSTFLNQCVFSSNIKNCHYIRPALWVSNEIFSDKPDKIKEILSPLDSFVGMENFKSVVHNMVKNKLNNPYSEESNYHLALLGTPGTGKTSVMEKLVDVFYRAGITKNKNIIYVEKSDLVGRYVGDNETKIKCKIRQAQGGILFIDEAYNLATSNIHDQPIIDGLLAPMERNDCIVVVAGYPGKMKQFLSSNAGLESRFGLNNIVILSNFTTDELLKIFENFCEKNKFILDSDAREYLYKYFSKIEPEEFGNARGVRNLFNNIVGVQLQDKNSLNHIKGKHVLEATVSKFEKTEISTEESMEKLEQLVGMRKFKSLIKDLICDIKQSEIDSEFGIDLPRPSLHMMLKGNPGTGKTTVGKVLAEVYYKSGLIKRNSVVKVERKDLVSDHIGGTEKKVKEILDSAAGGILFIDEAYSLAGKGKNDFGKEVIEGLLTSMTENRCVVIVAGYSKEMDKFLSSNSGLERRFPHVVTLDDYTAEELYQIFENICKKNSLILDQNTKNILIQHFQAVRKRANFGNAGYVENFFQDVKRVRNGSLPQIKPQNDQEILVRKTITKKYVEDAINLKSQN